MTKNWSVVVDLRVKRDFFIFWMSKLHVSQAFQITPNTSYPDSIQVHGEVLFKIGCKFIFHVF